MTDFPTPADDQLHDLGHGVSCQWIKNGHIIAFMMQTVSREAVDAWSDGVDQAAALLPVDQPVLLLHDLPAFPMTPYFRAKSKDLATRYRDKRFGRSALLVAADTFEVITRFFTEHDLPKVSQSFERRAFTNRETAIDWLMELHEVKR